MADLVDFFFSNTYIAGSVFYLNFTAEGGTNDSELRFLGGEMQVLFHVIYDYVVGNL